MNVMKPGGKPKQFACRLMHYNEVLNRFNGHGHKFTAARIRMLFQTFDYRELIFSLENL